MAVWDTSFTYRKRFSMQTLKSSPTSCIIWECYGVSYLAVLQVFLVSLFVSTTFPKIVFPLRKIFLCYFWIIYISFFGIHRSIKTLNLFVLHLQIFCSNLNLLTMLWWTKLEKVLRNYPAQNLLSDISVWYTIKLMQRKPSAICFD